MVFRRPCRVVACFVPVAAVAILRLVPSPVSFVLAVLAVIVPLVLVPLVWSTTVTEAGLVLRTVRHRSIAWTEIADIAVEEFAGDSFVELRLADGSRTRLPAPLKSHLFRDRAFDDRYAAIVLARRVAQPESAPRNPR